MSRPVVSVVIPTYNYAHYLPVAIESVRSQSGVDVEIIVVDDASTDDSACVATELAADDTRIRVLLQPVNRGHIATYNAGLELATGEYVVLLSADDALAPGSLERAVALLESHPAVGLVYGYAQDFSGDVPVGKTIAATTTVWPGESWIARMCERGSNTIVNPEAVMRRSVLERIGAYDPALPQTADMDLWMRAAAVSDVGRVNGPVQAYYRVHGANMHLTSLSGLLREFSARHDTFEGFFLGAGARLDRAGQLRRLARRSLAREGVRTATLAVGSSDPALRATARDWVEQAQRIWPAITSTPEWRRYLRRSARRPGAITAYIETRRAYARSALRWRRWRRYGT
ncbi:glycosyltransferase [Glaciihabitans sp. dw_435]|uniref:glycosyltransferase family 2 protein n=1 Tax=Glaciihabitans sp. dw_435 TaxID=2720081 RepID=UPI001BD606F5|nr:glycosyltransferase [Glaciihabitans sp. dw_435]